jgi:rhodanese-related sulfurtransferase
MSQISPRQFADMLATKPASEWPLLLDVREHWEFELASLRAEGLVTLHLPMSELADRLEELDASKPLVCLCHHGVRSAQVAGFLERRHGFAQVINFSGGIDAWSAQVDPTVPRY